MKKIYSYKFRRTNHKRYNRKKYNRKNKPNNDYFVSPLGNSFNSCNSKED